MTAVFAVILGGALVSATNPQYSVASLLARIQARFTPDYERKLSPALLAELRKGGFTLFVRHASRDGIENPASTALDRAVLIDPALVPGDFRWGLCLNELGRVESRLLGQFFQRAGIPVGDVIASPLCRARESAELSLGRLTRFEPSLVIDNVVVTRGERAARAEGLKRLLGETPAPGTNRVLFSHGHVLETMGYRKLGIEQAGMVVLQAAPDGARVRAVVTLGEMLNALPSGLPTRSPD